MLSADQLVQLIEHLKPGFQQPQQPPGFGDGGNGGSDRSDRRTKLQARHIKIEQFDGKMDKWDDWAFAFRRTIRSMDSACYKLMIEAEKKTEDVDETTGFNMVQEQVSGELYDILCQVCTSEALSVIKAVEDCEGISAWQKLFRKYNPKTMARGIRLLCEVTSPPKVKELKDIEVDLNKWEEKLKILGTQFDEKFSMV